MSEVPLWRTWKPYAAVAVAIAAGGWWYNSQSSIAQLKDGEYDCKAVFVNSAGKYEVLTDNSGQPFPAISATVRNGSLVRVSSLSTDQVNMLTVRKTGTSHFHATDDPALHSYDAVACDYAG